MREIHGRYRGDIGETQGRSRGDLREISPAGGVDGAQLGHAGEPAARQVEAPVDLHLRDAGEIWGGMGEIQRRYGEM